MAGMKTFHSYSEVLSCIGQEVAVSGWITITQAQIQMFADATGDQQWIHTDPERAARAVRRAYRSWFSHAVAAAPVFEDTFSIEGRRWA